MEEEYIETHDITYSCGCVHEIGLIITGGIWEPTGKETLCVKHK